MQAGDGDEGDGDSDGVGVEDGVGDGADPGLEEARQGRLAKPAQAEASDGDSELDAVNDALKLLMKLEDGASAGAVGFDELEDAGFADADERELGRGEESIGRYQEQDNEHPQQHVRNH